MRSREACLIICQFGMIFFGPVDINNTTHHNVQLYIHVKSNTKMTYCLLSKLVFDLASLRQSSLHLPASHTSNILINFVCILDSLLHPQQVEETDYSHHHYQHLVETQTLHYHPPHHPHPPTCPPPHLHTSYPP